MIVIMIMIVIATNITYHHHLSISLSLSLSSIHTLIILPIVRSHSFTVQSSLADNTHLPSGLNRREEMPRV